jgi:hypothetical protein
LQRTGALEQFQGADALNDAARRALLPSGTQQATVEVAEVAFVLIVCTRQTREVIAVKQAGGLAGSGLVDGMKERLHARLVFADGLDVLQVSEQGLSNLVYRAKRLFCRIQQISNMLQPTGCLGQARVIGLSRLQTLLQLCQLRV